MENLSDNAIIWTYKVGGDELTMTSPTGQTYTAKMNGTEAPHEGRSRRHHRLGQEHGKDTLEETDLRDGKVISVTQIDSHR